MKYVIALFVLFLTPHISLAEIQHCRAWINGNEVIESWDDELPMPTESTWTESALMWPGRTWNWAWGSPPKCDSSVLIAALAGNLPPQEIDGYCLSTGDDGNLLLVPGDRNLRGMCARTTCEIVNASKEEAVALTSTVGGAVFGTTTAATTAGITVVSHSSGALILSGNAGYIAGTLGTAGTTILGILTAPATLTAAAVSVVAVGGAVYVCSE